MFLVGLRHQEIEVIRDRGCGDDRHGTKNSRCRPAIARREPATRLYVQRGPILRVPGLHNLPPRVPAFGVRRVRLERPEDAAGSPLTLLHCRAIVAPLVFMQSVAMLPDEQPSPEQISILRRMTPEQRWRTAQRLYWTMRRHKAAYLRSRYSDWTEEQVASEVKRICLNGRT
ncbi:MAG TPA: hypothetical protein VKA43_10855 [Gammaproteobacteria bacterium]|nr:hypothetical protein [Gammaproteobacteria bacterium]